MADILSSLFGGGQRTDQSTRPDWASQALNVQKLNQAQGLFDQTTLRQFLEPGNIVENAAYTPQVDVQNLRQYAMSGLSPFDTSNLMSFDDYRASGMRDITQSRDEAVGLTQGATNLGRQANRQALDTSLTTQESARTRAYDKTTEGYTTARSANKEAYNQARSANRETFESGRDVNQSGYTQARGNVQSTYNQGRTAAKQAKDEGIQRISDTTDKALAANQSAFDKGYGLILDQASNYINRIATPQIQQQMVLSGLESGGAVPAAIARATAEYGGDLLSPLLSQYQQGIQGATQNQQSLEGALLNTFLSGDQALTNQLLNAETNLGGQFMSGEQALIQQLLTGDQALSQQLLSGEQALGNNLLNQFGNISQQDMSAIAALLGQYQQGDQALSAGLQNSLSNIGQQYQSDVSSFTRDLPQASVALTTAPAQLELARAQANNQRAQTATTLMPLADYERQLRESDLLRKQGLVTTTYTGIPFSPGSTASQRQSSQPLFNFFGQG